MHIILTHEQADFDAIASLLGASLLNDDAIPVLPSRMNRNVRAFITLYGAELPFVERRDLPAETVEAVTLVDTQSLTSIKGMTSETRVHVIDHHPLKAELPANWTIESVETGANTTLFVEALRESNGVLHMVHATLLLMGIYEDTGSLTYARTTARDLRAAAYLLEQGASLRIAVDFLNHPLSQRQQELYDQLRRQAQTYEIQGHNVVVSCADAGEMDEEFSTVAHKLRDLLDPDALFVLIKARGGIQFIARSTSDHIDVAEIAIHFGGGGHSRAAAALIKERSTAEVCDELIRILPKHIEPALTVAQIMSTNPQLISPGTLAEEASSLMQRYGYEGYPVVDKGKVIGLLTRRAVDRAVAHKLNIPAISLMDEGEVTVKPEDSIEYLQRKMTETGWGQVPVVHPETGQIIGIVTRTDLLKTLTPEVKTNGHQNLAARLETVLPAGRLALIRAIAKIAHEMHAALYIVGGFVRDLLLDRPSLDFDLVVEGDAIALAHRLARQYGGRITSHSRFGTAKWFLSSPGKDRGSNEKLQVALKGLVKDMSDQSTSGSADLPSFVDFITARREFYTHPSALPTIERGSIKLDLHRRDFTINTLALRLDGLHYGELYDYWGGLNDLRQKLVRCLHSLSFVDDPTRMLRAVRFEQRFGFTIERRTLQLLREALSLLDRVSGDRIRHELDHILDEEHAAQMLARLHELNLLSAVHPHLVWDDWLYRRIDDLAKGKNNPDWLHWDVLLGEAATRSGAKDLANQSINKVLWNNMPVKRVLAYTLLLIRLPATKAQQVLARIKASRTLTREILAACHLWQELDSLLDLPASKIVSRLDEIPTLSLTANYIAAPDHLRHIIQQYITQWRKMMPKTTGNDLRSYGLPPGPQYAQLLGRLRAAWLDGEVHSFKEERVLLESLIKGIQNEHQRGSHPQGSA